MNASSRWKTRNFESSHNVLVHFCLHAICYEFGRVVLMCIKKKVRHVEKQRESFNKVNCNPKNKTGKQQKQKKLAVANIKTNEE